MLAAIAFRTVYPWANAHWPGNGWRVMFFLGGLPALLSLFIRMRVKESDAWHEHRTDWAEYKRVIFSNGRRFFYLVLLMAMMNFLSHGTQDMYPTLLRTFGYGKARIADITILSMIGAVLGGLVFGAYSDRAGRRRAMISAASCGLVVLPLWIAGFSPWTTVLGVFLMQFFVQGAWGVIPAHINELAPGAARGFLPGFAYQLGVMFASSIPYLESWLGEMFTYKQAMGGLMIGVFIGAILVIWRGPEAHGTSFRKTT
jgi:SHS family lactate transporter-like MFS transporter